MNNEPTKLTYKGRQVEIQYLPDGLQEIRIDGRLALRQLLVDPAERAKQLIDAEAAS